MKRVTIDIDERYAYLLTITAMVNDECGGRCTVVAFDPDKVNHVRIDVNGKAHMELREDVVEVVRCGDCMCWKRNGWFPDSPKGICVFMGESRNKDEYCSYGKRVEDDATD